MALSQAEKNAMQNKNILFNIFIWMYIYMYRDRIVSAF